MFCFTRWLRHSCRCWRNRTALLRASETRILSGSRKIRPGSVSPWQLCRQTSVLLCAVLCRTQKLHRCVTYCSLSTVSLCLQLTCVFPFFLSFLSRFLLCSMSLYSLCKTAFSQLEYLKSPVACWCLPLCTCTSVHCPPSIRKFRNSQMFIWVWVLEVLHSNHPFMLDKERSDMFVWATSNTRCVGWPSAWYVGTRSQWPGKHLASVSEWGYWPYKSFVKRVLQLLGCLTARIMKLLPYLSNTPFVGTRHNMQIHEGSYY
jgi:hypothetical protein